MGALALGTEAPDKSLLLRAPYSRSASLISVCMIRNIFIQSVYQIVILLLVLLKIKEYLNGFDSDEFEIGSEKHLTIVFNTFVICQIIIAFTVIVQYLIVEYGGEFTKTKPLNAHEWNVCICLGAFPIPLGIIMRLIPVSDEDEVHSWDGHSP